MATFPQWYNSESKKKSSCGRSWNWKHSFLHKMPLFSFSLCNYSFTPHSLRVSECSPCGPCMCLHSDAGRVYISVSVLHWCSEISASHQQNCSGVLRWERISSCRVEEKRYLQMLSFTDAFHHQRSAFNGKFSYISSCLCTHFITLYLQA